MGCARSCFSYNNETPFNSSCVLNFPLSWNTDFNILRRERYFSTGSLSSQYEMFVLLLCSRIKAFYMNNSDSATCPLISVFQCSFHYCLFFVFRALNLWIFPTRTPFLSSYNYKRKHGDGHRTSLSREVDKANIKI